MNRAKHLKRREVSEEVGLKVANQPWSFPDSLMVGFIADNKSGEISGNSVGIREAAWFKDNY